ncbi:MAG: lactate utilization protein B [Holophaga sp.]|nr:lactate utilization protein B [Holophaga sp.]
MKVRTEQFNALAAVEIDKARARPFLKMVPEFLLRKRADGLPSMPDAPAAQAHAAAVRAEVVNRLPDLLEEFERNATANGAKVFWARDAKEANDFILKVASERGVKSAIKGKSMITEELGLNDVLSANGIEPWETDLGEFIAQQMNLPPFHIIAPAMNIPVEEIRDCFLEKAGMTTPTVDPVELGLAARAFLRDKFAKAGLGIAGVNMAVAETGTVINVENEGNIRFSKSAPKTLVSVMSLEKIVPTMQDAVDMIRVLARNCTGQRISAYVSMDSGPRKANELDGPEEQFIVILDNGRSKIYQDAEVREVMQCIRCAACLNICPVYRQIGGYAYGGAYSGPMGQALMPLLFGLDRTKDLYRACTLCGACASVCPAGIDHPKLFLSYRDKDVKGDARFNSLQRPAKESLFFRLWSFSVGSAGLWNLGARLFRPIFNWNAHDGVVSRMPGPLGGWFRKRDMPAMAARPFHKRWDGLRRDSK